MTRKPILLLDFDGVLHSYKSGWLGAAQVPDPPVPGAFEFVTRALEHFKVEVYSSRSASYEGLCAMRHWLSERGLARDVARALDFPTQKPPAFLTIDDRAICFDGDFSKLDPKQLLQFKPWYQR
jgi:hypothetical protein